MLDWLVSLLGEETTLIYLTFYLLQLLPLFTALLTIYLETDQQIRFKLVYKLEIKNFKINFSSTYEQRILIWRIKCLSKTIDEDSITPVY